MSIQISKRQDVAKIKYKKVFTCSSSHLTLSFATNLFIRKVFNNGGEIILYQWSPN